MKWLWNKQKRRYEDAFGDPLSNRELATGIDEYRDSVKAGMADKVAEFTSGAITTAATN